MALSLALSTVVSNSASIDGDMKWFLANDDVWQLEIFIRKHKKSNSKGKGKRRWSTRMAIEAAVESEAVAFKSVNAASRAYYREIAVQEQPSKRKLQRALPHRLEAALASLVRGRARDNMPMTNQQVMRFAGLLRKVFLTDRLRGTARLTRSWLSKFLSRYRLHKLAPEDKSIDRSAAESMEYLIKWYWAFADVLGLTINQATGEALRER